MVLSRALAWEPAAWTAPGREVPGMPLSCGHGSGSRLQGSSARPSSQVLLWQLLGRNTPTSKLMGCELCSMAERGGAPRGPLSEGRWLGGMASKPRRMWAVRTQPAGSEA